MSTQTGLLAILCWHTFLPGVRGHLLPGVPEALQAADWWCNQCPRKLLAAQPRSCTLNLCVSFATVVLLCSRPSPRPHAAAGSVRGVCGVWQGGAPHTRQRARQTQQVRNMLMLRGLGAHYHLLMSS